MSAIRPTRSRPTSFHPAYRIQFVLLALLFVITAVICAPLRAQIQSQIETAPKPEPESAITTVKIADNIYMLTGRGGNIGLNVGEDGAFVIDDKFAPLAEDILAAIATITDKPVEFVVNTHWHGDHTGGNEAFAGTGAMIVAHNNVRARLKSGRAESDNMPAIAPAAESALPVVTFNQGMTFHWNGETIDIKHVTPSHTDGDSIVIFETANVIHTGDVFVSNGYPFIDAASGGSVQGFIDNARTLLTLSDDNTRIVPGHGPLADRQDVQAFLEVLELAVERIGTLKAEGLSLQDVQQRKPMAEFDEEWGQGFMTPDRFIAGVYSTL